jgi:hypothetical protein
MVSKVLSTSVSTPKEKQMNAPDKIKGTVENWENGTLGKDVNHVKQAPRDLERQIDDAQGLQAISIRLDKELIEKFKSPRFTAWAISR